MEKTIHNVADLNAADREALEHLLDARPTERRQVVIHVVDHAAAGLAATDVPAWWKIYEGLDDSDFDRLACAIRERANLARSYE